MKKTQSVSTPRVNKLQPPDGGRVHLVRVSVNHGRNWKRAIMASCPQTGQEWGVRDMGRYYPAGENGLQDEEIILVNLGKDIPGIQPVLDWAAQHDLVAKPPRSVFAVAEHRSKLHFELEANRIMDIVSTIPCNPHLVQYVVGASLSGTRRYAKLHVLEHRFFACSWFAFGRG